LTSLSGFRSFQEEGFAVSVNNKFKEAKMTKHEFRNAIFGVHSFNPKYANKIGLKGFTVRYTGLKEIKISGTKLNAEAIKKLEQLKRGDQITVYNAISDYSGRGIVEIMTPMIITII
jgi:hypothetical protein